ncbi:MAG: prolipoprotein diacylglyceryl transferase [Clostridiales bacterium]|nr:prolipoprotein diacylglyceryl transferase [Clostridiales bacterium]
MVLSNLMAKYFTVFGLKIHWYAVIIVCGMMAAFFVISLLFQRRNMSADLFLTFFVICLPIAIATTRIFYCITDGIPFKDWWRIQDGGLAITGGILGGLFSVLGVCYFKKVNFFRAGDCIVVGLLLAQSIGRWGNFVNQEVFGRPVTNEALQFFPFAVYITDSFVAPDGWYYAFFFYESMVTLTAAILLFLHGWFNPKKPNGINTACYFIIYGLTRTVMEPLRYQEFILNKGSIPWSLVFSVLLCLFGVALLVYVLLTNKKQEGSLLGSANGDPYGISKFIGDTPDEVAYFSKINKMCQVYPERYTVKENDKTTKPKDNTEE